MTYSHVSIAVTTRGHCSSNLRAAPALFMQPHEPDGSLPCQWRRNLLSWSGKKASDSLLSISTYLVRASYVTALCSIFTKKQLDDIFHICYTVAMQKNMQMFVSWFLCMSLHLIISRDVHACLYSVSRPGWPVLTPPALLSAVKSAKKEDELEHSSCWLL